MTTINLGEIFPSGYSREGALRLLRSLSRDFSHSSNSHDAQSPVSKIGALSFPDGDVIPVFESLGQDALSKSVRRDQYQLATRISSRGLSDGYSSALFFFADSKGAFKLSLISSTYEGNTRQWNNPKRQSFSFQPGRGNKTFSKRIRSANIENARSLAELFSITQVTADFYQEFELEFEALVKSLEASNAGVSPKKLSDVSLLLVIRTIFLGFIQEKGWLGEDRRFLQESLNVHLKSGRGNYYRDFLKVLFLEALNTPSGTSFSGKRDISTENYLERGLTASPYLNGGLFRVKPGYDDLQIFYPDEAVNRFFEFIFSFEFTVEENSAKDEDLQLNPEFLGIIFERVINKEDGAVYTPRPEVALMSNLAILEWLDGKVEVDRGTLTSLVFEDRDFASPNLISKKVAGQILLKLSSIRVIDPAVGSGAFLVGMLQALNSLEGKLIEITGEDSTRSSFERQKEIIGMCLFGVEVREWAVWICQLRLWLAIFVDAPDDLMHSKTPILPALDFRVQSGDSLVQSSVKLHHEQLTGSKATAKQMTLLKRLAEQKADFYLGRAELDRSEVHRLEMEVRRELLRDHIAELQSELDRVQKSGSYKLESLFDEMSVDSSAQRNRQIEALQGGISLAEQDLLNVDNISTLVWDVEFADIFRDKQGFDIVIGNPPYIASGKIADPLGRFNDEEYKNQLGIALKERYPDFFIRDKVQLSKRSDLYSYFYGLSLAVLNPQGVHVFICSNTWLDIETGYWLKRLLSQEFDLRAVIDNTAAKSFERADVNTVITVVRSTPKPQSSKVVFTSIKVPFGDLHNAQIVAQQVDAKTSTSSETLDTTVVENSGDSRIHSLSPSDNWGGMYLRTPQILKDIVQQAGKKLVGLGESCEIAGYVHDNLTGPAYPATHFIKTVKDSKSCWLDADSDGVRQFGVATSGKTRKIAQILIPRTFGLDHRILVNKGDVVGKEFYRVYTSPELINTYGVFLNSTFGILQREVLASAGLGGGALKLATDSVARFLVPSSRIDFRDELILEFLKRKTLPIAQELGFKNSVWEGAQDLKKVPADRLEVDRLIFASLGLDDATLPSLYQVTASMVKSRDDKARS